MMTHNVLEPLSPVRPTPVFPVTQTAIPSQPFVPSGKLPQEQFLVRTVLQSNMTIIHKGIEAFKHEMEDKLTRAYRQAYVLQRYKRQVEEVTTDMTTVSSIGDEFTTEMSSETSTVVSNSDTTKSDAKTVETTTQEISTSETTTVDATVYETTSIGISSHETTTIGTIGTTDTNDNFENTEETFRDISYFDSTSTTTESSKTTDTDFETVDKLFQTTEKNIETTEKNVDTTLNLKFKDNDEDSDPIISRIPRTTANDTRNSTEPHWPHVKIHNIRSSLPEPEIEMIYTVAKGKNYT